MIISHGCLNPLLLLPGGGKAAFYVIVQLELVLQHLCILDSVIRFDSASVYTCVCVLVYIRALSIASPTVEAGATEPTTGE